MSYSCEALHGFGPDNIYYSIVCHVYKIDQRWSYLAVLVQRDEGKSFALPRVDGDLIWGSAAISALMHVCVVKNNAHNERISCKLYRGPAGYCLKHFSGIASCSIFGGQHIVVDSTL